MAGCDRLLCYSKIRRKYIKQKEDDNMSKIMGIAFGIGILTFVILYIMDSTGKSLKENKVHKYISWVFGNGFLILGGILFTYLITDSIFDRGVHLLFWAGVIGIYYLSKTIHVKIIEKKFIWTCVWFVLSMIVIIFAAFKLSNYSMVKYTPNIMAGFVGVIIRQIVDRYESDRFKKGAILFALFMAILIGTTFYDYENNISKEKPIIYLEKYIENQSIAMDDGFAHIIRLEEGEFSIFELGRQPLIIDTYSYKKNHRYRYYKGFITEVDSK